MKSLVLISILVATSTATPSKIAKARTVDEKTIHTWAREILEENHDPIFKYSSNESLEPYIADIYKTAFLKDRKIVNDLLDFSAKLKRDEEKLAAYGALLDLIKKNDFIDNQETVKLAFLIKGMEGTSKTILNKKQVSKLKDELPQGIQNLAWEFVCLYNNFTSEFIAPYAIEDHLRRNVHSNRYCDRWTFEQENSGAIFYIKGDNGEYLYAEADEWAVTEEARRVFMRRNKQRVSQGRWEVIPINNGQLYVFRNVFENEYLFNSRNKNIYTWRRKGMYQCYECFWQVLA